MDFIVTLLIDLGKGILFGALFLVLAIVLLPERLFFQILGRLKPDIVSKRVILSKVVMVFDQLFNFKEVIVQDKVAGAPKALQEEVSTLLREKRVLEGNLFFLDQLKSLTGMLQYSVYNTGHGESTLCEIIDQSMTYIQAYANKLDESATSRNIEETVAVTADRLSNDVIEIGRFLQTEYGEENLRLARMSLQQGISQFDAFMKREYESTKETLRRLNQRLADRLLVYMGEPE
jgi:hypothetical protein